MIYSEGVRLSGKSAGFSAWGFTLSLRFESTVRKFFSFFFKGLWALMS